MLVAAGSAWPSSSAACTTCDQNLRHSVGSPGLAGLAATDWWYSKRVMARTSRGLSSCSPALQRGTRRPFYLAVCDLSENFGLGDRAHPGRCREQLGEQRRPTSSCSEQEQEQVFVPVPVVGRRGGHKRQLAPEGDVIYIPLWLAPPKFLLRAILLY